MSGTCGYNSYLLLGGHPTHITRYTLLPTFYYIPTIFLIIHYVCMYVLHACILPISCRQQYTEYNFLRYNASAIIVVGRFHQFGGAFYATLQALN